jgi:ferric-dicitrate binding protein FerR (iron transport regulator)
MLAFVILSYWMYPQISGYFNIENRDNWYAVTNDSDEPKSVQMPDGSTIVLNKKAMLRYPEKFDKRAVELSGEAYFQITFNPQKSFKVYTAESEIEVLGTSFNVRNPENSKDVFVMVESGKVSFKNPRNEPLLLLAGKGAYFNAQKSEIELKNNPNSSSWKTKTSRFQNTTVKEVLASLESVYGLNIQVSNDELLKCEFNGTFDKFQPENILYALSFSLGAELSFSNNIYLLTGEGCNQ